MHKIPNHYNFGGILCFIVIVIVLFLSVSSILRHLGYTDSPLQELFSNNPSSNYIFYDFELGCHCSEGKIGHEVK